MPSDGPSPAEAPRRSPTRSPPTYARWAARSPRERASSRWLSSPARGRALRCHARTVPAPRRDRLAAATAAALERYRYGPGVFKVDWALSGPIPWAAPECAQAGTVHLGGTLDEIAASERAPGRGETSERPFVLLAQPTVFDPSRAPAGNTPLGRYCHVPNGSTADMTEAIERQIERFAPGFGELFSPAAPWARPTSSDGTRTSWAGTSQAARTSFASSSPVLCCGRFRTRRRSTVCISVLRRRLRVEAFTACADRSPRVRRYARTASPNSARRRSQASRRHGRR